MIQNPLFAMRLLLSIVVVSGVPAATLTARASDDPVIPLPAETAKDLELFGTGVVGKALPAPAVIDVYEYLNLGSDTPVVFAEHHEQVELPEAKQLEIFQAALAAERRAEEDTARKFPNDATEEAMDYTSSRLEKYRGELRAKYGISSRQLVLIVARGYEKSWPTRPRTTRTELP